MFNFLITCDFIENVKLGNATVLCVEQSTKI